MVNKSEADRVGDAVALAGTDWTACFHHRCFSREGDKQANDKAVGQYLEATLPLRI